MTVRYFLDTNVLVYAAIGTEEDDWKRKRALELMLPANFGTSGQVLQEFFVTVTRKGKRPLSLPDAAIWVDRLSILPLVPTDGTLVKLAIQAVQRHQVSYWDGAIIAAAEMIGAPILYTEDLNHGQAYGSVKAINPFRPA